MNKSDLFWLASMVGLVNALAELGEIKTLLIGSVILFVVSVISLLGGH